MFGMTVPRSHDSMCERRPAESWERSRGPSGVNSRHQSVSRPVVTIVIRRRGEDSICRGNDGQTDN